MLRFDRFERLVFSITYLESIPTGNPTPPPGTSKLFIINNLHDFHHYAHVVT
jgi:hypothetical protein